MSRWLWLLLGGAGAYLIARSVSGGQDNLASMALEVVKVEKKGGSNYRVARDASGQLCVSYTDAAGVPQADCFADDESVRAAYTMTFGS